MLHVLGNDFNSGNTIKSCFNFKNEQGPALGNYLRILEGRNCAQESVISAPHCTWLVWHFSFVTPQPCSVLSLMQEKHSEIPHFSSTGIPLFVSTCFNKGNLPNLIFWMIVQLQVKGADKITSSYYFGKDGVGRKNGSNGNCPTRPLGPLKGFSFLTDSCFTVCKKEATFASDQPQEWSEWKCN